MPSHYPSSGAPSTDGGGLGEFAPTGEPTKLSDKGAADAETGAEQEAALAEFGGLKKRKRLSSLTVKGTKIDVPLDGQQKNIYNLPPAG